MHKNIIGLICCLLFSSPALPAFAAKSTSGAVEAKVALESSLEKRVRSVLSEALGTEDLIVIINAELYSEDEKSAGEILPGVPEKETPGTKSLAVTLTMVKHITATIILDKSVSEEDIKLTQKLAAGLLGIPPDRQDMITIEKMNFRKTAPFNPKDLFHPPHLWNLLWVAFAVVTVIVLVLVFFFPFSGAMKDMARSIGARTAAASPAAQKREDEAAGEVPASQQTRPQQKPAISSAAGAKPPFWFLENPDIANLTHILQKMPVDAIAVVLNYAPRNVACALVESLRPKSVQALALLHKTAELPETSVRAIESLLLAKLDFVVGGEEKAVSILELASSQLQESVLSLIAAGDKSAAHRISASMFRISDLELLEPPQAQLLARRVHMRLLAQVLKGSPYADGFVSKLLSGMQERLRQEMELARTLPKEAAQAQERQLVEALKQLAAEGLILIKSKSREFASGPEAAKSAASAPQPVTGVNKIPGEFKPDRAARPNAFPAGDKIPLTPGSQPVAAASSPSLKPVQDVKAAGGPAPVAQPKADIKPAPSSPANNQSVPEQQKKV